MKKKICAALLAVAMMFSLAVGAFAADSNTEVIDLGDGYYMVTAVEYQHSATRSNLVYGKKTGSVYAGSTKIGSMTVYGEFDISGSTAQAQSGSIDGSGYSGWDYKSGYTTCSGNKVTGSAKFASGATAKTFDLILACSPSGSFS